MWTNEQLAYFAGIIDGEGTIYIQQRNRPDAIDYFPRFQIVNTDHNLMDWIQKTFGGLLYTKNRSKHNKKWRTQYEWYTTRKIIDVLLPLVIPYLIVKKPQAEIMLIFRQTFKKRINLKVSHEVQSIRDECRHKMQALNKRGIN